jgi:hypothetical protein
MITTITSPESRRGGPPDRDVLRRLLACRRNGRGASWVTYFLVFVLFSTAMVWAGPPADGGETANSSSGEPTETALRRSLEFLMGEMESWPRENGCYSCHNNGDAARVVYRAMLRKELPVRPTASDSWLLDPERWQLPEEPGPEGDQRLANLQFALAAKELAAVARDATNDRDERKRIESVAAETVRLARLGLHRDEHWPADPTSQLGSPITYGPRLGTALVRQLLEPEESAPRRSAWRRTGDWLVAGDARSTLDAAARILGLTADERRRHAAAMAESRKLLFDWQQNSGGWGPYPESRPEIFDTAVAILALAELGDEESGRRAMRGRQYLIDRQWGDGSWTETTRPSGRESYAQRISTTAWAALALLETVRLAENRGAEAASHSRGDGP